MSLSRRLLTCAFLTMAASVSAQPTRTRIVMLGTGTPVPDPDRAGPSVAIVVDSVAYLFDAGTGVVRRAVAASRLGVPALAPPCLERVFLTHLHSDHTLGLADLLFTPWIQGRVEPLEVYGPPGTTRLVRGITDGNVEDIRERVASAGGPSANGWNANVHEIHDGLVYRDERITVRAFHVPHSAWRDAFGFRIETPDRTIVISGDTKANDIVAAQCHGCDVLIHEVFTEAGFDKLAPERKPYHAQAHTSATELGAIATAAKPGLLVLYHQLYWSSNDDELLREVRAAYTGRVVSAHDLDIY
jgi:ribonuclease BN (tRNA processing enzyme)